MEFVFKQSDRGHGNQKNIQDETIDESSRYKVTGKNNSIGNSIFKSSRQLFILGFKKIHHICNAILSQKWAAKATKRAYSEVFLRPKGKTHISNQNCQGEGLLNKPVLHQEAGDGVALCHHEDGARVQAALHSHLGGRLRQVIRMMMMMMMMMMTLSGWSAEVWTP